MEDGKNTYCESYSFSLYKEYPDNKKYLNMSFLPDLNSKGEIVTKKEKAVLTFDWSNLQIGRCPVCGNYLKPEGKMFTCEGKDHEKPFRIKESKMRRLKTKMVLKNERIEQYRHIMTIE